MENQRKYQPIKLFLLLLITSIGVVNLFGNFSFDFQALSFNLAFSFWPTGETIINIPPLGQISATTHDFPVRLIIQLTEVDIYALEQMESLPDDIYTLFISEIKKDFSFFVIHLLLAGVLTGITATAVFISTNKKTLFLAGLIVLLFISFNLLGVYFFYQPEAFAEPAFSGTLSSAPWMMDLISESLLRIEELSQKMQTMVQNIYHVFEKIEKLEPLQADGNFITLLHISDIHNNVVALNLVESIIDNFNPDLIIDTGDLVDYGTTMEAELVSKIEQLELPYLFLPGNHDSPELIAALTELDNVHILKGNYHFEDLRLVGHPDPLAASSEFRSPTATEITKNTETIKEIISIQEKPPHIIVVHNHRIANNLRGKAPLILHGHTHSKEISIEPDSIIINAGTTGAAGLRSLETTAGTLPYTMVLIRLKKMDSSFILQALDTVIINDLNRGFTLKRNLLNREFTLQDNN